MIRCAFFEMNRLPSRVMPRRTSVSISSISAAGLITTPQPITQRHPEWRMPEGIECKTYFSRPTTTVWPALSPPWYRTTTLNWGVSTSTTLPLPSSPHCVPTTTMLGMVHSSPACGQILEYLLGPLQHLRDRDRALPPVGHLDHQRFAVASERAADDQRAGGALAPRAGQRLGQRAAHDVAGHRRAEIAQPARQRQRRGLVGRGIHDEEVGT